MGTNGSVGASRPMGWGAGSAAWRVPVALALALASLPLAFVYGYGTVAAAAALLLLWPSWREGQRTAPVWAAALLGVAGLALGGFMLVAAIGLCGVGVLVGTCSA